MDDVGELRTTVCFPVLHVIFFFFPSAVDIFLHGQRHLSAPQEIVSHEANSGTSYSDLWKENTYEKPL